MSHDIVNLFGMAARLRRESGLKHYERESLKRIYMGSDRETKVEIQRELGTQFIKEVFNIELEIGS